MPPLGARPLHGQRSALGGTRVGGHIECWCARYAPPGRAAHHSVWVFWEHEDGERRHSAYYVNMEEPFRRNAIGFDTNDHTLDIVVTPDLDWRWKDEDELAERVELGVYPADFADFVRAEGERVIGAIESGAAPFGDGWSEWEPPSDWVVPSLPAEWETEPVTLWDRRVWAYGDIAR